jgi:ABC-type phosphate/phosphonate transport system substrate-binding protein
MASHRYVTIHLIKIILLVCWCGVALANNTGEHAGNRDKIIIGYSFSLFVGVDMKDVQAALDVWINELAKVGEFKQPIETRIYDNLEYMVESIRQRTVDFVAMNMVDYLRIRNKVEIEPALIATNRGKVGEEYALIIHKGVPWTELKQLRGKNLLVEKSSGACSSALMWLDTLLLQQHLSPSQGFFQSVKLVEKGSQAVLPVFFRQAEACLMPRWSYDTMVELNPQIKEQTTILILSPLLAQGGLFIVKGIPPRKREVILSTQKVWQTVRAKQLMTLWHTEGVVPFQPAYIQTMVHLYNEYSRLTKGR